jgi:hypothetical protein
VDRRNFACSGQRKVFFNYPRVLYHDGEFHEASIAVAESFFLFPPHPAPLPPEGERGIKEGTFSNRYKLRLRGAARGLLSLATQAWLKAAPGDHPDFAGKIKKLGL